MVSRILPPKVLKILASACACPFSSSSDSAKITTRPGSRGVLLSPVLIHGDEEKGGARACAPVAVLSAPA